MLNLLQHTFSYFSQFTYIDIELHFAPAIPKTIDRFVYIHKIQQYFNDGLQPTYCYGVK